MEELNINGLIYSQRPDFFYDNYLLVAEKIFWNFKYLKLNLEV